MGASAFLEPMVVVFLLFGGAWINRAEVAFSTIKSQWKSYDPIEELNAPVRKFQNTIKEQPTPSFLISQTRWRQRDIRILGLRRQVTTPNTAVFRYRFLSRVLHKFPFLIECWYWALIYWVYRLGRAFTAVTLQQGTVHIAREHALQLIEVEKRWHIFWEVSVQQFFMQYHTLMTWINWLYSFVHIPGTIAFLVWLYYYTITRNRLSQRGSGILVGHAEGSTSGSVLYEARRRTMAVSNLTAFGVFTVWPCMPPRLLSDTSIEGPTGEVARSYGFIDTVRGKAGAGSVWTQNQFCNQYAAMPSLHFGYFLLIGLTIMSIPLSPSHRRGKTLPLPFFNQSHPTLGPRIHLPSMHRILCICLGFLYPFSILVAIISTANHFILDALAGAVVCALGWWANDILLNLLPVEDWFLWLLRMHKPVLVEVEGHEAQIGASNQHEEEIRAGVILTGSSNL